MDYSSVKYNLALPEYGVNIQKMVDHTVLLEDREERLRAAQTIINIMGNLFPYLRDTPDFKHKLWDHLAIMSNFKLDIDYPYDLPQKEVLYCKPEHVDYISERIKQKHYGVIVEHYIAHLCTMEDGEEKKHLVTYVVNHMKRSFLLWNRDNVDDVIILNDLERLSNGKLKYTVSDIVIQSQSELVSKIVHKKKPIKNQNQNQNQKQNPNGGVAKKRRNTYVKRN